MHVDQAKNSQLLIKIDYSHGLFNGKSNYQDNASILDVAPDDFQSQLLSYSLDLTTKISKRVIDENDEEDQDNQELLKALEKKAPKTYLMSKLTLKKDVPQKGQFKSKRAQEEFKKSEQKLQRKTHRTLDESDNSDVELPENLKHVTATIQNNEYLKMYQMMNPMHDGDRERAASIAANLFLPNPETIKRNPFLNKILDEEPEVDLHALDLQNIAQITPDKYQANKKNFESDIKYKEDEIKHKQIKIVSKRVEEFRKRMLSNTSVSKPINLEKVISKGLQKKIFRHSQSITKEDPYTKSSDSIDLQPYEDRLFQDPHTKRIHKISNLSQEILATPHHQLKQKFTYKSREMDTLVKKGQLSMYDTTTLVTDRDRQIFKDYEPEYQLLLKNKVFTDAILKINLQIPNSFKKPMQQKYCIEETELTPMFDNSKETILDAETKAALNKKDKLFDIRQYLLESKHSYINLQKKVGLTPLKELYKKTKQKTRNKSLMNKKNDSLALQTFKTAADSRSTNLTTLEIQEAQAEFKKNKKQSQLLENLSKRQIRILSKYKAKVVKCGKLIDQVVNMEQQLEDIKYSAIQDEKDVEANHFEMYEPVFDKKQIVWTRNALKGLDYQYQRLNYKALSQERGMI